MYGVHCNHLVSPVVSPEVMNQTQNEGDNASFTCQVNGGT